MNFLLLFLIPPLHAADFTFRLKPLHLDTHCEFAFTRSIGTEAESYEVVVSAPPAPARGTGRAVALPPERIAGLRQKWLGQALHALLGGDGGWPLLNEFAVGRFRSLRPESQRMIEAAFRLLDGGGHDGRVLKVHFATSDFSPLLKWQYAFLILPNALPTRGLYVANQPEGHLDEENSLPSDDENLSFEEQMFRPGSLALVDLQGS